MQTNIAGGVGWVLYSCRTGAGISKQESYRLGWLFPLRFASAECWKLTETLGCRQEGEQGSFEVGVPHLQLLSLPG
jgi:hypothetical protein